MKEKTVHVDKWAGLSSVGAKLRLHNGYSTCARGQTGWTKVGSSNVRYME